MSACPEKIVTYMHEYLDGDINTTHEEEMKQHLHSCESCQTHLKELKNVVHLLQTLPTVQIPLGFKERVMEKLPKPKLKMKETHWLRKYPLLIAAAIFAIFMSASLLSGFNNSDEFAVTEHEALVVEGSKVTVPIGETIDGDLVVKNGDLTIDGKVNGDVTVVNGKYMASTANVTGEIEEIDETFEWLWYSIKDGAKKIFTTED